MSPSNPHYKLYTDYWKRQLISNNVIAIFVSIELYVLGLDLVRPMVQKIDLCLAIALTVFLFFCINSLHCLRYCRFYMESVIADIDTIFTHRAKVTINDQRY